MLKKFLFFSFIYDLAHVTQAKGQNLSHTDTTEKSESHTMQSIHPSKIYWDSTDIVVVPGVNVRTKLSACSHEVWMFDDDDNSHDDNSCKSLESVYYALL